MLIEIAYLEAVFRWKKRFCENFPKYVSISYYQPTYTCASLRTYSFLAKHQHRSNNIMEAKMKRIEV